MLGESWTSLVFLRQETCQVRCESRGQGAATEPASKLVPNLPSKWFKRCAVPGYRSQNE